MIAFRDYSNCCAAKSTHFSDQREAVWKAMLDLVNTPYKADQITKMHTNISELGYTHSRLHSYPTALFLYTLTPIPENARIIQRCYSAISASYCRQCKCRTAKAPKNRDVDFSIPRCDVIPGWNTPEGTSRDQDYDYVYEMSDVDDDAPIDRSKCTYVNLIVPMSEQLTSQDIILNKDDICKGFYFRIHTSMLESVGLRDELYTFPPNKPGLQIAVPNTFVRAKDVRTHSPRRKKSSFTPTFKSVATLLNDLPF